MPETQKSSPNLRDMLSIQPSEAAYPILGETVSDELYEQLSTLSRKAFMDNQREQYNSMRSTEDALSGIRKVSIRSRDVQFTSLFHHLTLSLLSKAFHSLRRYAASGCDKQTWKEYEANELERLIDLRIRLLSGTYRPLPVLRKYIPKANGSLRPLGICSVEDKIVQSALNMILEQIYEPVFEGLSYGFRPYTRAHDALDALAMAITTKEVNYVLDADIVGCFDNIDKNILMEILKIRIKDKRILHLIRVLLDAGILDKGELSWTDKGVIQGSVISPLLANIFLDFVLDKFFIEWRKDFAKGEMYLVRYADDFVVCFELKEDALRFKEVLEDRLKCAGLELHKEKTRLLLFGKHAQETMEKANLGKPETFNFLGFCHSCSVTFATKRFKLLRTTISSRLEKKIAEIKEKLENYLRAFGILETIKWLRMVINGYYNYFAIHDNLDTLSTFRFRICEIFYKLLHRLSQRSKWNWDKFNRFIGKLIPTAKVTHPYPSERFDKRQKFLRHIRFEV